MFPAGKDLVPCIYAYRRSFTGPYLSAEGVLLLWRWLGAPRPSKDLLAAFLEVPGNSRAPALENLHKVEPRLFSIGLAQKRLAAFCDKRRNVRFPLPFPSYHCCLSTLAGDFKGAGNEAPLRKKVMSEANSIFLIKQGG